MRDFCYHVVMDEVKDLRMRLVNAMRVMDQMGALLRDARPVSPAISAPLVERLESLRDVIEKVQQRLGKQAE